MNSAKMPERATASRFATQSIAEAIADERPVDWTPAERALGNEDPALASLRLIDDVARAFRANASSPAGDAPENPLFRWGPLAIIEALGQGMTGEVYRAFDPALQRSVALKLRACRDPVSDPANAQLLDEARRLARIRHQNVLAVFGAAVHDGRAGIWAELIDGRTLAEIIAVDGSLSASEAVAVGLDVCRALMMVHEAGLVHGDVKAENVMRERGGRIVLMDFGASGRSADLADRTVLAGTRRCLPPEILSGEAAPDEKTDLYGLAVLLYFLLTGKYPTNGMDTGIAPLRGHRPDLPNALVDLIDGVLERRDISATASAARFYDALLRLQPSRAATAGKRRAVVWAAAAVVAVCVASAFGLLRESLWPPVWTVTAQFVDPASGAVLVDGTPVRIGDTLAASVETSRQAWAYVLNEDAEGELSVLFPVPGLDQQNPLPAGRVTPLPGEIDGKAMSWEISSPSASDEFVLIIADRPLAALAEHLAEEDSVSVPEPRATRGAARLRDAPTALALEGKRLAQLVALARDIADENAGMHLSILSLRLPHAEH